MFILDNLRKIKHALQKILVIICTIPLLTACASQGETVAESTVSPTPTLPPNKGPSAIFTATPDPNVTPYHTPSPTPLSGFEMIEADGMESQQKIKKMLTYSFEEDNTYDIRPQSDFASEEEYVEFIKTECERKYKENLDYLQSHEIDAWYIKFELIDYGSIYGGPIYVKITNKQMVTQINQMIQDCSARKNPEYSIRKPLYPYGDGYEDTTFCVEKDGKITRMFETDLAHDLGVKYFENEPSLLLPYGADSTLVIDFLHNWADFLTQLIVENYVTQSEVNLVFN